MNSHLYFPLSNPQRYLYLTQMIYPESSMFNIGGIEMIYDSVDIYLLEKAICSCVNANSAFKIRIVDIYTTAKQYFSEELCEKVEYIDLSDLSDTEFDQWVQTKSQEVFVLEDSPLYHFTIFKRNESCYGYLIKMHHIIADGWSFQVIVQKIADNYSRLKRGETIDLQEVNSYKEFLLSEQKYFESYNYQKDKEYWENIYKELPVEIPPLNMNIEAKRKCFYLTEEESDKVRHIADSYKMTVNIFFITLYLIYISKITGNTDLVIGIPMVGRFSRREREISGMFVNVIPFRFQIRKDESIEQMMHRIYSEYKKGFVAQRYPVVKNLHTSIKTENKLYSTCINYYSTKLVNQIDDMHVENYEFFNGQQEHSLQLIIREWSDNKAIQVDIDYKVDEYKEQYIDFMFQSMRVLLEQMYNSTLCTFEQINLCEEPEIKHYLWNYNNTNAEYSSDKTVIKLFEEQAKRTPERTALILGEQILTYYELDNAISKLAFILQQKHVTSETVGIMMSNSFELIVAIFAVMKVGSAFVPIDVKYPVDRINYIIQDANMNVIISNEDIAQGISFQGHVIRMNQFDVFEKSEWLVNPIERNNAAAYLIYTSGSTGKPKGVIIEHKNLCNYVCWAKKQYIKREIETFPLFTSVSFDLTMTSIFVPLISGSQVVIYQDRLEDDEYVLYRILRENKVSVIKLTPSHLSLIADLDNSKSFINRIIVGGENLRTELAASVVDSFMGDVEILNEYGPTEATIGCMIHQYSREDDVRFSVPIGKPAANTQIYILNKDLNPLPSGIVGELYISGDGVARGYWNKKELTDERFIQNPFMQDKRMYKTGDLAKFIDNNNIEYIGRADNQVKINGYRIELAEIENCLLNHDCVTSAVVIDVEEESHEKYIVAFIVQNQEISIGEIKEYLLKQLPAYMVPLKIIKIDTVPLTLNGKINRDTLIRIAKEYQKADTLEDSEAKTNSEVILLDVMNKTFKGIHISRNSNFYNLGGDSIKAIKISSLINEKGYILRVKDILAYPNVIEMAQHIKFQQSCEKRKIDASGEIITSPIAGWFLSKNFVKPNFYNQCVLCKLIKLISKNEAEIIYSTIITQHDSLRICYDVSQNAFYYSLKKEDSTNVLFYDLTDNSDTDCKEKMYEIIDEQKGNLDISSGVLCKFCLFNLRNNEQYLYIIVHHLAVDGVSWNVLLEDISTVIMQIRSGRQIALPEKTDSYKTWVERLVEYGNTISFEEEQYWKDIVEKENQVCTQLAFEVSPIETCETLANNLNHTETSNLLKEANSAYLTEPKDIIITALLRIIKKLFGSSKIKIELEGHGREDIYEQINIARTVGWFTSIYPIYIELELNEMSDQIKYVKEYMKKIPKNGIGYGILTQMDKRIKPIQEKLIRFNYLGEFTAEYSGVLKVDKEKFSLEQDTKNNMTSLIEINCYIFEGEFFSNVTYSQKDFSRTKIKEFSEGFHEEIRMLVQHCCGINQPEFTPSDFEMADLTQEDFSKLFI